MQNALNNNQSLIDEYKEKNDTLNGLVAKYSGYAEDNERLRGELATTKDDLTERAVISEKAKEQLERRLKDSEDLLTKTKEQHQTEINILREKKDIEREKALVELERKNQEQLTAANEKIRSLYDEIAQIRNSYEEQLDSLKNNTKKPSDEPG